MADSVGEHISVVRGDITELVVDAIVNAANPSLAGGGGVDGAIHRVAGPELDAECRMLGGCATGDAVMTKGYRLPARFVIHTVGPVWRGGGCGEDELLASCYRRVMEHARSHNLRTVAFPAISTGAYGFPLERATRIAVRTAAGCLKESGGDVAVIFVCHSDEACKTYSRVLNDPAIRAGDAGQGAGDPLCDTAADTHGDIREQVAGQLGVIEAVYGVHIVNREVVINEISKKVNSRAAASLATAALNGWVATGGISGDRIAIPEDVIARAIRRSAGG